MMFFHLYLTNLNVIFGNLQPEKSGRYPTVSTTGTDKVEINFHIYIYDFIQLHFRMISCNSRNKTSKQKANKKLLRLVFPVVYMFLLVLFPVEKTTDFNSSQPEIRVQLAVHIDVDPKVGTDGGCFGLIAALTLGTAAGETGPTGPGQKLGRFGILGIL